MHRTLRTLLFAACSLFCLPCEVAAQIPPPAGQNSIFLFAQQTLNGEELVVALPEFAVSTAIPLTGAVSRTQHRRSLATPSEPEITVTLDAVGAGPYAALPVQVGANAHAVDVFDFRAWYPAAPTVVPLGQGPVPYDLLAEPANGRVWVCEIPGGGNGALRLYSIALPAVGPPTRSAGLGLPQGASPYATRMVVDPLTGNIAVPMLNGIALVDPNSGGLVSVVATPLIPGTQQPFVIGTNLSNDFSGATPASNLLCGLRSPLAFPFPLAVAANTSAGALSLDGAGNNVRQAVFTGQNGAGSLSLGFHEIATSGLGANTLATFIGFSLIAGAGYPVAPNVGQGWQIDAASFTVGTFQSAIGTPIGNPEARRGVPGGPVCSLGVAGVGVAANAMMLMSFDAAVLPAPQNPMGGALLLFPNPAPTFSLNAVDRPLSLPGTDTWMVPTRPAGPPAFAGALVTLARNPGNGIWVAPPGPNGVTFFASGVTPTTRPNVLSGTLPASYPPFVPVAYQSMGPLLPGPPPTGILASGAPLTPAPTTTLFPNALLANTIGGPFLLGTGPYLPNVGAPPANFGARVPVFNFASALPFVDAPWLAVPVNPIGGTGMVVEFYSLANATSGFAFGVSSSTGFLTTEITAY